MNYNTLRPGLLVSLSARISGNVKYESRDIEVDHLTEDGTKLAVWETQRTTLDPAEHEESIKVRGKARSLITGCCAMTSFGLLCPESNADELDSAFREAKKIADEFNARARLTRVNVYCIVGRVAADDMQAVSAINSEVRNLLDDMESGVRNLDAGAIREAANKARNIGSMLTPDAAKRVQSAIESARLCARKIVKSGEQAAGVIDNRALAAITDSRTMFLDLDDAMEVESIVEPSRALDLEPDSFDPANVTENDPQYWQEIARISEETLAESSATLPQQVIPSLDLE